MTAVHPARPRPPARRLGLACLPLLGLGLAACAGTGGGDAHLGWIEAGSPKQLQVEQAQYRHVVRFATDSAALEAAERDRLLAFLASVDLGASDVVRLEGHADERASEVYNLDLASRRAQSVAAFLRQEGHRRARVVTTAYGKAAPADPGTGEAAWRANRRVELVLERHVVVLPGCPDWSRESGTDFANLPHSNLGCATETNLGLMVAEPRDLVRGRSLDTADGVREAEAVGRYRSGRVTQLQKERVE
jgi:pilus assembly protein CpaD